MGNIFTINMEETFRKNQDFINEMNAIKLETQLQMRKQMRDKEVAIAIAKARDLSNWFGAFYLVAATAAFTAYRYRRRPVVFVPLLPLTFITGYQFDLAYGNKIHRITAEAEHILQFEQELLSIPLGMPTASSFDLRRMKDKQAKKLGPIAPTVS